jgi:putative endonuclease
MTTTSSRLGRLAEDLVAEGLAEVGWEILERNARTRYGELDLIALDGATLVFVEVKAGRVGASAGPERPVLAVGPRKRRRVRHLATAWMADRRGGGLPRFAEIRFDAVGVSFGADGRLAGIEHIRAAF